MFEPTTQEIEQREKLAQNTKAMVASVLPPYVEDKTSLMLEYKDFYLQISFTLTHPLMAITLVHATKDSGIKEDMNLINKLNLSSVLGCHSMDSDAQCYSYRATQWLDIELSESRFFEILDRCYAEASDAFNSLSRS